MDLVALHRRIDDLMPDLARSLMPVVEFDAMGLVFSRDADRDCTLYQLSVEPFGDSAGTARLEHGSLPAIQDTLLAGLWASGAPVVVSSLDDDGRYPEVVDSLRAKGRRSACLLPLVTTLRPVGMLAFGSSRIGAYDNADLEFLLRVAANVAIAADNVRLHEAAGVYQRQLEVDRDHWRTLLELNNALVTTFDLSTLRDAIAPNLRGMVPHDYTNLSLHGFEGETTNHTAYDPALPHDLTALLSTLRLEDTPMGQAMALRRPTEVVVGDQALPAEIGRHVEIARLKRVCFVPLFTTRRTLGLLSLGRCTDDPFTSDETARAAGAAGQIAIAIENALAYQEIATLKNRLALENLYLEDEIRGKEHFEEIIGDSKAMQRVLAQVRSVADTDSTVLLLGETGTGKELIARALHATSGRRARTLVTVNCATSPAGLLESEWFGHEKGAFTGAVAQKVGRFELAHNGTLFLDEIGDVPLDLQAKLLRALQEHEIDRLGSSRPIRVNFRLVAATNRHLEEMVAQREFRADLYYRLNVFPIRIPPLRERRDDIPPLVRYFVQRYAKATRRTIESVTRESMDAMCRWHWPGNVRELQNVIERAVILSQGPVLHLRASEFDTPPPDMSSALTLDDVERGHIRRVLDDTGWVIGGPGGAALRLGLNRTTLVSIMRRLGIVRPKPGVGR